MHLTREVHAAAATAGWPLFRMTTCRPDPPSRLRMAAGSLPRRRSIWSG